MDCCNYGEYRTHGQYGAGAGWEGYSGYAPLPYAPYAHSYYAPHAHDPYARYYRYEYPGHHVHHAEHVMPMEYGVYASKEARVRRSLARREQRAHSSAQHLPLPPTPPLECGLSGHGSGYEPHMWPHYQMGVIGNGVGWNGPHSVSSGWTAHGSCTREHMRYRDCRSAKAHVQNPMNHNDSRSTPYHRFEESTAFSEDRPKEGSVPEFCVNSANQIDNTRGLRGEQGYLEPRRTPPVEKRPPVVPLPAFQQAFGSTEIGKFAEAFSRAEVALEEVQGDNFVFDTFSEWDGPNEPQWSSQPASKEIKCEDNY